MIQEDKILRKITEKIRRGIDISESEKICLKNLIVSSGRSDLLSKALYIYSYNFSVDDDVMSLCYKFYESDISDELSSICAEVALLIWRVDCKALELLALERLSQELYEDRFEEYQTILRAYNSGSLRYIDELSRRHLLNFVSWGLAEGYSLMIRSN